MKYTIVEKEQDLETLRAHLEGKSLFAFDTETTGLDWTRSKIFMISLSDGNESWVIPTNRFSNDRLALFMKYIMRDPNKAVVGHNIKFDAHQLMSTFGVPIDRQWHDTLTMAYLLDENRSNKLKSLMPVLLDVPAGDESNIHAWMKEHQGKQDNWDFSKVPEDLMIPYSAMDPWACFRIYEKLKPQIDLHFGDLYETERKVIKIMWKMEQNGILVDNSLLTRYVEERETAKTANLDRLFSEADITDRDSFNPDSPDDLRQLFYDKLKLPIRFYTEKKEPSTKDDALIAFDHPVAELIQIHRSLGNGLNYAKGLLAKQDRGGYVHGDYSLTRTKTGRFSCSEPNLQNVPKDKDLRACFVADPGWNMFYFDHAQIEMAGFAHYSKDPKMVAALKEGQDLHALVASEVYEIPLDAVTKDQRSVGKGANFSIIYGVGRKKLASYINGYMGAGKKLSDSEAQAFKERYFRRFPTVPRFQQQAQDAVRTRRHPWNHFIRNQFGRVRRIQDPVNKAYTAVNHLIQGWAPDLMKRGMVQIEERLKPRWRQNVHDELRMDAKSSMKVDQQREWVQEVARCLTHFPEVRVPIACKVEWSNTNWAELKQFGQGKY